jgi:hypothetical protein
LGWERSPFMLRFKAQIAASPVKAAVLAGLTLVLLVVLAVQFLNGPSSASAAVEPPVEVVEILPVVTSPSETSPAEWRPELPDLPGRLSRDLFASPFAVIAPSSDPQEANPDELSADNQNDEPTWTLKATYLSSEGDRATPMAIIDGMMVREGDRIRRYVVESIESRQVVLKDGSLRIVLRMP